MRSTTSLRFGRPLGVAIALALSFSAACSTEAEQPSGGGAAAADDPVAEAAQEALAKLYGQGTYTDPPTEGPEAQSGHKIALVSAGVQSPSGTAHLESAQEAAELLGWDLTVFDAKYDPSLYSEGIRQAISQDADVIWAYGIDCAVAQTAYEQAREAEIPVVSQETADCSDSDPAADSYFHASLEFTEGTFVEWAQALGAAQAQWLMARLGEDTRVIEFHVAQQVVTDAVHEGFIEAMETCSTCEVTTVEIPITDQGTVLQEKVETALLRNPEANGMMFPFDDLLTGGGAAAILASGRNDSLEVIGGTGFAANVDLIHENKGQDAGYAYDFGYETWASADVINRVLAGEEPARSGVGIVVIDADEGLPPPGEAWSTGVDFESAYKELWGVN